jgi:hypothetical protein
MTYHPRTTNDPQGQGEWKIGTDMHRASAQVVWEDSLEAGAAAGAASRRPIDYLTLDYLVRVTMSILQKQYSRDKWLLGSLVNTTPFRRIGTAPE